MDCFGTLWAVGEVEADGLGVGFCTGTGGGREEEEDWSGLEHHLYFWLVKTKLEELIIDSAIEVNRSRFGRVLTF